MVVTGESYPCYAFFFTLGHGELFSPVLFHLGSTASLFSFPFFSCSPLHLFCFQLSELPAWPHPLSPKLRDVMWEETVVCDVLLLWNYKQGEIIYANIGQTLVSINTRKYAHSIGLKYCVGIWFTNYRLFSICLDSSVEARNLIGLQQMMKMVMIYGRSTTNQLCTQHGRTACSLCQSYGW